MKKRWYFGIVAGVMAVSLTGCGLASAFLFQQRLAGALPSAKQEVPILHEDMEAAGETGALAMLAAPGASYAYQSAGGQMNGMYLGAEPVPWNTEEYNYLEENGWKAVSSSPFSTFAADVDTASYANVRRMILRGQEVNPGAVRIEEMINYFHYDYPQPEAGEPFSVTTKLSPCPWNPDTQLLLVGLQAQDIPMEDLPPANLVFLIDVSGSMDSPDKLPLVQRAFRLITENLRPEDRISIVTYASSDEVVLDGVSGDEPVRIQEAIEDLMAGGGTNGSDGIITAYNLAEKYFVEGGVNRVILATDGDLNIGITDEDALVRLITQKASSGIDLSVLGFGTGNLADARMEALADHGNGNYSYIDDIAEARRVLVQEMGGTLVTVAKDVKLQVEFNPAKVRGYRLIGYENRLLAAEDFADDKKDGGEIGAGHQVTALYEIADVNSAQELTVPESRYQGTGAAEAVTESGQAGEEPADDPADEQAEPAPFADEYLTVNLRYKAPGEDTSSLLVYPVGEESVLEEADENMTWAACVSAFGMTLRRSEYLGDMTLEDIRTLAASVPGTSEDPCRVEFLYMVNRYAQSAK